MKRCPYCAEEIHDQAIVCRYCGRDLEQASGASKKESAAPPVSHRESKWIPILFLVVAAGAIPGLWNLANLAEPPRLVWIGGYLAVHLLAIGFGTWVALLWQGMHPAGNVLLALLAGGVEAVSAWFVITKVTIGDVYLVSGVEDYIGVIATVLLFIAGALVGERVELRRAQGRRVRFSSLFSKANSLLATAGTVVALIAGIQQVV